MLAVMGAGLGEEGLSGDSLGLRWIWGDCPKESIVRGHEVLYPQPYLGWETAFRTPCSLPPPLPCVCFWCSCTQLD